MTRQILYVAAPLRPTAEEIAVARSAWLDPGWTRHTRDDVTMAIRANIDRAMRWLDWLRRAFPETTFTAPWIASILAGADDSDPAQREAGMRDNEAIIERCDGIVLCGGRVSTGMRREMDHGIQSRIELDVAARPFVAYDLTGMGAEPPHPALRVPGGCSFREWHRDLITQ